MTRKRGSAGASPSHVGTSLPLRIQRHQRLQPHLFRHHAHAIGKTVAGDVLGGEPRELRLLLKQHNLGERRAPCETQASGPHAEQSKKIETDVGEVSLTDVTPAAYSCPCHGGAYDLEGNRTAGPPVRALDRFYFSIKNDRLFLGEAYAVAKVNGEGKDARIRAYTHAGPGQHVDGPEAWLYPIVPSQVST